MRTFNRIISAACVVLRAQAIVGYGNEGSELGNGNGDGRGLMMMKELARRLYHAKDGQIRVVVS